MGIRGWCLRRLEVLFDSLMSCSGLFSRSGFENLSV